MMILTSLFRSKSTRPLYQYYAQVHYLTCEKCLKNHGKIFSSKSELPPIHEGCRCNSLEIPPEEVKEFESKRERMNKKAQQELERRKIFKDAKKKLEVDFNSSLELFQQAVNREIYLGEIEELVQDRYPIFEDNPQSALKLRDLFIKYYRWKFGKRRYETWPEPMRLMREKYGVGRIQELFQEIKAK